MLVLFVNTLHITNVLLVVFVSILPITKLLIQDLLCL